MRINENQPISSFVQRLLNKKSPLFPIEEAPIPEDLTRQVRVNAFELYGKKIETDFHSLGAVLTKLSTNISKDYSEKCKKAFSEFLSDISNKKVETFYPDIHILYFATELSKKTYLALMSKRKNSMLNSDDKQLLQAALNILFRYEETQPSCTYTKGREPLLKFIKEQKYFDAKAFDYIQKTSRNLLIKECSDNKDLYFEASDLPRGHKLSKESQEQVIKLANTATKLILETNKKSKQSILEEFNLIFTQFLENNTSDAIKILTDLIKETPPIQQYILSNPKTESIFDRIKVMTPVD